MSQQNLGANKTFPCTNALPLHARVVMNGTTLDFASATQVELGVIDEAAFLTTLPVNKPVRMRTAQGTIKMNANGVISQYATVYAAANGQVAGSGVLPIGIALEAAVNNNDVIEVLRYTSIIGGTVTVAALGSVQGDGGVLQAGLNVVTAADGTKGVKLPVASVNTPINVINNSASILKVWPAVGGGINVLGANVNMAMPANSSATFQAAPDLVTWWTTPRVPS